MSKLKGLQKARPTALLVDGDFVQYVHGLKPGDYGLVKPDSMIVSGDYVYGLVYDSNNRCSPFRIPIAKFPDLQVYTG